jgi:hypothetical protein
VGRDGKLWYPNQKQRNATRSIGTQTVWDLEQRQLRGCFRVLHNDTNRTTSQRHTEIVVAEKMRCSPATECGGEKGSDYEAGQRFSQAQTKDYLTSRLIVEWYSLSLIGFVNALEVLPLFVVTIYCPSKGVPHGRGLVQPANILASPLIDITLHEGLYKPRDIIKVLILLSWALG